MVRWSQTDIMQEKFLDCSSEKEPEIIDVEDKDQ